MFAPATFENFQQELARLVEKFDRDYPQFVAANYNEATLRNEFLDPFFRALGWDVGNINGLIHTEREVDIEVHTATSGRQTRADYVFRYGRVERFTCEAKKPAEALSDRHIYQAKRDAFARGVPFALLSDFEDLKIYIVGARPHRDEPHVGEFKILNFRQYVQAAREIWDLLAYEHVRNGSLDREIAKLPKRPLKLKGRQGYLIRPDRTRSLDADFLNFLDDARQQLGSDLLKHNDRADLLSGHRLNDAAQRIIDRLIFLRICEDRGIDTGELLHSLFDHWYRQQTQPPRLRRPGRQSHLRFGGGTDGSDAVSEEPGGFGSARDRTDGSLYREITDHVRSLDHRPASHKPFFNGQLFAAHFSEELIVGDEWLANFILDLTDDDTGYSFATIKVEILGDAYEHFLGKVLRPQGRGATIEEKPEVRKAGGVYYTPRYITDYIVEQTIARQLEGKPPREVEKLRFVDPACGSGSFLLRAYERVMEHHLRWFIAHPAQQKKAECYTDAAGNVRLTTALKRRILVNNIYGVDIDAQAVEVTQLSLYLKMLEDENRDTLRTQTELFRGEPLLPPLDKNIRCFNSLIASDFSLDPADLVRVNAGDWDVQFPTIMKAGGFDAVIGNPPYVRPHRMDADTKTYLWRVLKTFVAKSDLYSCFMERAVDLTRPGGLTGFIVPHTWTSLESFSAIRRKLVTETAVLLLTQLPQKVFQDATVETCIFVARKQIGPIDSAHQIEVQALSPKTPARFIRRYPQSSAVNAHLFNLQLYTKSETSGILAKVEERSQPLGEIVSFVYGFKTADDERFIHPDKRHKESQLFIRSAAIARYCYQPPTEYVWYVPAKMIANRKTARPGDPERFRAEKILVARMGKKLIAAYDEGGLFVKDAMLLLPHPTTNVSLKFIVALLNSRLLGYIYREFFVTIDVLKNALLQLPIVRVPSAPTAGNKIHDQIVSLADKMILLTAALHLAKNDAERRAVENAIAKTDHDIDQLVYQLYALTPEEIALVEGLPASDAGAGNPAPALEAN